MHHPSRILSLDWNGAYIYFTAKMNSQNILIGTLGIVVFLVSVTLQDDMCGMPAPDPTKTCVSLRLPWNPQPMYFCTEKSNFRYRNQCQNRFQNHCGANALQHDTLMVAAPWDCCPMVSYPDSCASTQCPPAPLNRKCQTMEPNPSQPWECCNSYFCEENMTPETCHFKRLEPNCNMPPQDKKNCVAFVDPFGCCPKFQCDEDARPGHCPAEVEAMKFMARFNTTNMIMIGGPGLPMMMHPGHPGMVMGGNAAVNAPVGQAENKPAEGDPPPPPSPPAPEAGGGEAAPPSRQSIGGFISQIPGQNQNQIACVGDFNCPGTMKCCSNDMNVYVRDGVYFFRNRNPTYGYCMEAVMMNTNAANTKSGSQGQK